MRTFVTLTVLLLTLACASGARAGEYAALIIGVSDYPGDEKLTTSIADARELGDVLTLCAGYASSRVSRLTAEGKGYHKQPTAVMVRDSIEHFCGRSAKDDTIVIYIAGRFRFTDGGVHLLTASGEDRGRVPLAFVLDTLADCRATRKLLIIDVAPGAEPVRGIVEKITDSFSKAGNVVLLLSTGRGQKSHVDTPAGRGIFSKHLVEGLEGKADTNGDKIVTLEELHDRVKREMIAWSVKNQNPQAPVLLRGARAEKYFPLTGKIVERKMDPADERRRKADRINAMALNADTAEERFKLFREAMKTDSTLDAPYANISHDHYQKGEYDEAIRQATAALELNDGCRNAYITRARSYIAKGQKELGMKDYDSLVELHPDCRKCSSSWAGYTHRGHARRRLEDYDLALRDFNLAIEWALKGSNYYLGHAYSNRGICHDNMKNWDQAIVDLDRGIQLCPDYGNAWLERGRCHKAKGNFKQAVADLTEAIRLQPDDLAAYRERALVYGNDMNDLERSLADHRQVLRLAPDSAGVYTDCADMLTRLGRYERALKMSNKAIRLDPKGHRHYLERGRTLHTLRRYNRAFRDLRKSIELKPTTTAWYLLARSQVLRGDHDEAIESSTRCIALDRKFYMAYWIRGDTYRTKGDYDRALADLKRAIENYDVRHGERRRAEVLYSLGLIYVARKEYKQALAQCDHAVRISPGVANVHTVRAFILSELGRHDEAMRAADLVVRLAPKTALAHNTRAYALNQLKRYDEAIKTADRAIGLNPKCAPAYINRGWAKFNKDDVKGALADLDKSIEMDPSIPAAMVYRAEVHLSEKNFDKAWADVKKCRELKAEIPDDLLNRLKKASGRDH